MRKSETISLEYRQLNQELHSSPKGFGGAGHKRAVDIIPLLSTVKTVLDYGAGQAKLSDSLKKSHPEIEVTSYDPAVLGIDKKPNKNCKFDLVVCTDVLEHVELEFLENVLKELWDYTAPKGLCYLLIACNPSGKILSDGRNAHLIQEQPDWWIERIITPQTSWEVINKKDSQNKYQEGQIKKVALVMRKPA